MRFRGALRDASSLPRCADRPFGARGVCVALGDTVQVEPFNEADDFELVDADAFIEGDLADGKFAVFVVGEPHMPTLQYGDDGAQPVKKICFKVLADDCWDA